MPPRRRTGSNKDANFRLKFGLPGQESVVDDFSCAISKEVLLHGRLYASAKFMCFYSNIFGHKTTEIMPFARVVAIEKRNTSLFIPNAIEVTVWREDGTHSRRFFTSFKERDAAIAVLTRLWAEHKAADRPPPASPAARRQPEPEPEPELRAEPVAEPAPPAAAAAAAARASAAGEATAVDEIDMMLEADENQEKIEMTELVSFTLAQCRSCADFFQEFFADDSDYTLQFRERRGDSATELTPWQRSASLGHTRTVRFISPVKGAPIGPKTTEAEETQRYQLSPSGSSLLVQAEAIFPRVPYGECFKVVTQYSVTLTAPGSGSVKVAISSGIRWLKSTWWESLIADGTRKENTESFQLWQRLVESRWAERLEASRSSGGNKSPPGRGNANGGPQTVSSMLVTTSDESVEVESEALGGRGPQSQKAALPFRPTVAAASGKLARDEDGDKTAVAAAAAGEEMTEKPLVVATAVGAQDGGGWVGTAAALLQSRIIIGLAGAILLLLFVVHRQLEQIEELSAALAVARAAASGEVACSDAGADGAAPCPAACAAAAAALSSAGQGD